MGSRTKLTMGVLLTLAACTRVGPPAPTPVEQAAEPTAVSTSSALSGVATMAGQRLRVTIRMETDQRGRGTAHLEIPDLPLAADGQADWTGTTLDLDLRYAGDCPGELRIRASRIEGGDRLEGTLSARDCTGEESGQVVLALTTRPPGGVPAHPRVESAAGGV